MTEKTDKHPGVKKRLVLIQGIQQSKAFRKGVKNG
jgi:hypothetical protein